MNDEEFNRMSRDFRSLACHMATEIRQRFKLGQVVRVESPRFTGHGLVSNLETQVTAGGEIGVRLENGNVWNYPADHCRPVTVLSEIPRSVRRMKLQRSKINTLHQAGPKNRLP